jgi:hypothetical protein
MAKVYSIEYCYSMLADDYSEALEVADYGLAKCRNLLAANGAPPSAVTVRVREIPPRVPAFEEGA